VALMIVRLVFIMSFPLLAVSAKLRKEKIQYSERYKNRKAGSLFRKEPAFLFLYLFREQDARTQLLCPKR
jgi:hypothetical protein